LLKERRSQNWWHNYVVR